MNTKVKLTAERFHRGRCKKRPTIALALGSGSARGWAHIGVIRALQREQVPVDLVCGTSIGAVVGAALAADAMDTLESWVRELDWTGMLRFMDITLPRSGLIEGEKMILYIREHFSEVDIQDLPMPFTAVATELSSGRELWLRQGPLLDAIRASISMPGIFTPTLWEGRWLVDGGLVDPVPVSACRAMGAEVVIAVNLNTGIVGRHRRSRERKRAQKKRQGDASGKLSASITTHLNHTWRLGRSFLHERFGLEQPGRGPSLFEVLVTSIHIMQDGITRHRLAADPPDILIAPRLAEIGLLDFNRADEAIQAGEDALLVMLPLIRDIIG
jgi:NTE family protein